MQRAIALAEEEEPAKSDVGALCRRVAHELLLLQRLCKQLEGSLCNAADAWGLDDARVRDLQMLDFLTQHLEALGDVLHRSAAQPGAQAPVALSEILGNVPLADLKVRLWSGDATEPPPQGGGRLELF